MAKECGVGSCASGRGLTPKQERFCYVYIETGNASEAYRQAYDAGRMKPETVNRNAKTLLENNKITTRLNELREGLRQRHEITVDRVLAEYAKIAFFDPRSLFNPNGTLMPINELDADTAAVIGGLDVLTLAGDDGEPSQLKKIKLIDKKGALDSLAKHLKMFVDRHEFTGKDGGPIETRQTADLTDDELEAELLKYGIKPQETGADS